ncbi:MAG: helix-turn-helix transcriptional regulator [Lentimicrobiaceae bacterium]|nr:helix-turn-helix transcriptional regulator [Lentimicrobiaceae bacterium]
MESRLKQILKYKKLTASQFADAIGVQRSSVSHVLSGRNKPSMDFIEKILRTYPEINAEYLILGLGTPLKDEPDLFHHEHRQVSQRNDAVEFPEIAKGDTKPEAILESPSKYEIKQDQLTDKTEEQTVASPSMLICVYPDGSFRMYHPRKSQTSSK